MGVYITKIDKFGEKEKAEKKDRKAEYKDIEKREKEYYKYYRQETNLQIINNKEIDRYPDRGIFVDISNLDIFLRKPKNQKIGNA